MSIVICKLPSAGLGNQLFPLMKAQVFSHLNNFRIMVTGYNQIKIGPYIRREKSKRNYQGYFAFQKGVIHEQLTKLALIKYLGYEKHDEPDLVSIANVRKNNLYLFHRIPHWSDYFKGLKEHRELVIRLFWDILAPGIRDEVERLGSPFIGVHLRKGDYRKLMPGEDFSKVGMVRTPETYFIETINEIRRIAGTDLPVSVFTDGYKHEFEELFSLGNIQLVEGNQDIVDLLLLSKSKIIVTSAGSTFSSWAGFLSNAPLIMHPDHIHQPIRPSNMADKIYEGKLDSTQPVLINNIKSFQA